MRLFVLARHGESTLNVERVVSGDPLATCAATAKPCKRARRDRAILVVTHEIPVRYALNAAEASADLDSPHSWIANATPDCFGEDLLAAAAERLVNGRRGRR